MPAPLEEMQVEEYSIEEGIAVQKGYEHMQCSFDADCSDYTSSSSTSEYSREVRRQEQQEHAMDAEQDALHNAMMALAGDEHEDQHVHDRCWYIV